MASTEGLVPITRSFLSSYYDKHPFTLLADDVSRLSTEIRGCAADLLQESPPSTEENLLMQDVDSPPPHKIDENLWKNREQIEEILYLLKESKWPLELQEQSTPENNEMKTMLGEVRDKLQKTLKKLEGFQAKNSDNVFNTVMTYLPQDFRGTIIRQQRERSERNKQAVVDSLVSSGGSIHDRYAVLWKQQMDRRRQLAQLGSATGVYKTLVKYLVGVPQVLLDFVGQINDDNGPMEEQRHHYGPILYSLTKMVFHIRFFLALSWRRFEAGKLKGHQFSIFQEAVDLYALEFERFITFLSEVFAKAPFFISAEEAGALKGGTSDEYKEISVAAGKTHEVVLTVESINSYIAWDFALAQSKMYMDIGFSIEYTNASGEKMLILPYRRYESDQGNFCTILAGNYKLIWDNSYSSFFKKTLRFKVDCIPPVTESTSSGAGEEYEQD